MNVDIKESASVITEELQIFKDWRIFVPNKLLKQEFNRVFNT